MESEKLSKKAKGKIQNLEDLPPRVIIFDILSFHEVKVTARKTNHDWDDCENFELFGIFRKDNLRKIWSVFTSIAFLYPNKESNCWDGVYIDFPKLGSVFIEMNLFESDYSKRDKRVLEYFMENARNFYRLKRLRIEFSANEEFEGLFSHPDSFPKLDTLQLVISEGSFIKSPNLERVTRTFEGIRNLELDTSYVYVNSTFPVSFFQKYAPTLSQNLERLKLMSFTPNQEYELNVPNLKILDINKCYKLRIITSKNLKSLIAESLPIDTLRPVIRNSLHINKLILAYISGDNLRLSDESLRILGSHLEVLDVHSSKPFKQIFFNIPFPKLRTLSLSNTPNHDSSIMSDFALNVKNLYLMCMRGDFNFRTFENKSCEGLEKLIIQRTPSDIDFTKWVTLKSLKKMGIYGFTVNDDFDKLFRTQEFSQLEVLLLSEINQMNGQNWTDENRLGDEKKFRKLRKICIKRCRDFSGHFFSENKLPCLKHVILDGNEHVDFGVNLKEWNLKDCVVQVRKCELLDSLAVEKEEMKKKGVVFVPFNGFSENGELDNVKNFLG